MILGAAHWLGCIWWSLASIHDFDESTWVFHYCDSFLSPCSEAAELGVSTYTAEHGVLKAYSLNSLQDRYLLALYWGFQSLTNLGYSDLIPDNALEMVFAWFLCVFQVSFYAYILGTLFSFVVKKDNHADSNRRSIAALESYCKNRKIPPELQDSLTRYFSFQVRFKHFLYPLFTCPLTTFASLTAAFKERQGRRQCTGGQLVTKYALGQGGRLQIQLCCP